MNVVVPMQVADSPRASQTSGVAELMRQLDVADADIALVKVNEFSIVALLRGSKPSSDKL